MEMPVPLHYHGKFEVMSLVVRVVNINPILINQERSKNGVSQYHILPFDDPTNINIVTYMDEHVAHCSRFSTTIRTV
jgi:hypothetical protein